MPTHRAVTYIALGANSGDRRRTLERALRELSSAGIAVDRVSALYETEPVGGPRQRRFLNAVVRGRTRLAPHALLRALKAIETACGRRAGPRWGPRPLDLDLLTYGRLVRRFPGLIIPHPRYHERRFVLAPFCDVAPGLVHPRLRRTNRTLSRQLTVQSQRVTIFDPWKKRPSSRSKKRSDRRTR